MISNRGKIAVIHPAGYLDTVPCLMSALVMLDESGYEVDVVMAQDQRFVQPKRLPPRVKVHLFHSSPWGSIAKWGMVTYQWLRFIRSRCTGKYVCYIGIDAYGLLLATVAAQFNPAKVVYFSLELLASDDIRTKKGHVIKALERIANQKAALSIIQDNDRAAQLIADNGIDPAKVALVPNSSIGSVVRDRSDFLRVKFNIPAEDRIILSIGEICARNQSLELVRSAEYWPANWRLILHTRERIAHDEYTREIAAAAFRSRTIISETPVSFEELHYLTSSADLGVVLYSAPNPSIKLNIELVGLSSGKLANYLQAGLPVIVTAYPGLKRLVDTHNCGLSIKNAIEIVPAMSAIFKDYDLFRENAYNAFSALFDFRQHFNQVLLRLESFL